MSDSYPVALFNGVVITANGEYKVSDITKEDAKALVDKLGFVSAVGHEATASVFSQVLEKEVKMNRIQYRQSPNQNAIALKLNQRPAEGSVLNIEEVNRIGYKLKLIERVK